jgi:transcriptional regulator with XRE-family HTH domain
MTQRDLSRLTGYSMRLIGEVERGKEHVAPDKLLSILDVLSMTMTGYVEEK